MAPAAPSGQNHLPVWEGGWGANMEASRNGDRAAVSGVTCPRCERLLRISGPCVYECSSGCGCWTDAHPRAAEAAARLGPRREEARSAGDR